ncbi:MAG: ribosome-associated translation inhibitor RaiA [Spirochaetales bacterium]|nr:ribosome-associated translation inhibitor RaiA [Spirochaetales bacterium]
MHVDVKGVHYHVSDNTREFIDKKMQKLDFAKDYIMNLRFTITKGTTGFTTEVNVSFKWGKTSHVKEESFELWEALELLFDKLQEKVKKEKAKIQDH